MFFSGVAASNLSLYYGEGCSERDRWQMVHTVDAVREGKALK